MDSSDKIFPSSYCDTCLCIVGWNQDPQAYKQFLGLRKHSTVDIHIAAHRPIPAFDPDWRFKYQEYPNENLDWGAYKQWLETKQWKQNKYQWFFFMHDDVEIRDFNILEIAKETIVREKLSAVANGKGQVPRRAVLRGSFWGCHAITLYAICGQIPIPHPGNDYWMGNKSMTATTDRIIECTGRRIGWLHSKLRDTPYLFEEQRGSLEPEEEKPKYKTSSKRKR